MADWWAGKARARERWLPVPGSERWARRRGCFAGRDVGDPFQTGQCAEAADPGFSDRNPRCSAYSPDPITSDHQSCVSLQRGSSGRTMDTRRGRLSLPDRSLRHRALNRTPARATMATLLEGSDFLDGHDKHRKRVHSRTPATCQLSVRPRSGPRHGARQALQSTASSLRLIAAAFYPAETFS